MPLLAIGAVDLIAMLIALFVSLLIGAGWTPMTVIRETLKGIPLVGGYIASAISNGLESVMNSLIGAWDGLAGGFAHLLYMLGTGVWHILYTIIGSIESVFNLAQTAQNQAAGALAAIPPAIDGVIAHSDAYATAIGQDILHSAEALVGDAQAQATAQFNQAEAFAEGVAQDVLHDADALYDQSIAHADTLYNQAIATAQDLATQAANDGIHEAQTVYLEGLAALGNVQDVINSEINALADSIPGEISAAIAAAGVAGIAGLATRVATLEAEATECLEPLCDTVTPNAPTLGKLGQFLGNLETLGIDALFIALAAEAATDPAAVVADVKTVVTDVGEPILTGFRDLIGV